MKHLNKLAAVMVAAALVLSFVGCANNSEPDPKKYTVTFDTDGGSDAPEAQKVEEGKKAEKPEDPTKTGYTFDGWYNGEEAYDFDAKVKKKLELKAKWTANQYKVTLVYGDGEEDNVEVTATYDQLLADLTDIPDGNGATFGGYYTEKFAEGTKFIDIDGKGCTEWNIGSDTTLYAAFGIEILYDNTKNLANPNPNVYYTGKGLKSLAPLDGTNIGYEFLGWSLTSDGEVISG